MAQLPGKSSPSRFAGSSTDNDSGIGNGSGGAISATRALKQSSEVDDGPSFLASSVAGSCASGACEDSMSSSTPSKSTSSISKRGSLKSISSDDQISPR